MWPWKKKRAAGCSAAEPKLTGVEWVIAEEHAERMCKLYDQRQCFTGTLERYRDWQEARTMMPDVLAAMRQDWRLVFDVQRGLVLRVMFPQGKEPTADELRMKS